MANQADVRLEFLIKETDPNNKAKLRERVEEIMKSKDFDGVLSSLDDQLKSLPPSPTAAKLKGVDLSIAGSANDTGGKPGASVTVTVTFHF